LFQLPLVPTAALYLDLTGGYPSSVLPSSSTLLLKIPGPPLPLWNPGNAYEICRRDQ